MSYLGNNNLPWDISRSSPIPTDAERFSGNSSTTAFTLTRSVNFPTDLEVFVENIQQEPTTAYSVNGNSLLFTEAPPTGTNNVYVVYRNYQSGAQVSLPDGSITYSKLANNIRVFTTDNFTANGNVSSYGLTEPPADANTVFVTVDGVVQRAPVHYTTSGTTITFTSAPPLNANVHIRHLGFRTTSTVTALPANSNISQPTIIGTLTTAAIVPSANATSNIGSPTATYNNIYGTHVGAINAPNDFGFKNRLINGAMQVWQRGTSFTGINNSPTYSADRWGGFVAAVVSGEQILRSTSVPTGFQYSAAFGRTASNTNTNSIFLVQLIESVNMLDLASQTVTLSFWAKSGANYSGGNLSVLVNSGTSADQSLATFSAGPCTGYTGNASVINGSQTITSTWTRYTFTGSVGATAQELGVAFGYTPTGTAGADDNIYITGVQLEKGSIATAFDYRSFGTELRLCQRYYYRVNANSGGGGLFGVGWCRSTTEASFSIPYPTAMRTNPTALEQSGTAANYQLVFAASAAALSAVPVFGGETTTQGTRIDTTVASGLTAGQGVGLRAGSSAAYLAWSAEL